MVPGTNWVIFPTGIGMSSVFLGLVINRRQANRSPDLWQSTHHTLSTYAEGNGGKGRGGSRHASAPNHHR